MFGNKRKHILEQQEESIDLHAHSDEWVTDQNDNHTDREEAGRFQFVTLTEEPKGALHADYEGQSGYEEDLNRSVRLALLEWPVQWPHCTWQ